MLPELLLIWFGWPYLGIVPYYGQVIIRMVVRVLQVCNWILQYSILRGKLVVYEGTLNTGARDSLMLQSLKVGHNRGLYTTNNCLPWTKWLGMAMKSSPCTTYLVYDPCPPSLGLLQYWETSWKQRKTILLNFSQCIFCHHCIIFHHLHLLHKTQFIVTSSISITASQRNWNHVIIQTQYKWCLWQ